MQADLSSSIDLGQNQDTYVTFLVRENTAPLSAAQLASNNRTLSLNFLSSNGASSIRLRDPRAATTNLDRQRPRSSRARRGRGWFYVELYLPGSRQNLWERKRGKHDAGLDLCPRGDRRRISPTPAFRGCSRLQSSAGFNPVITQLQFASPAVANFTVSNLCVGSAASLIAAADITLQGDFNHDGLVDSRDYLVWRDVRLDKPDRIWPPTAMATTKSTTTTTKCGVPTSGWQSQEAGPA